MNIKLSPSMLSIDFGKVAEQLKIMEELKAEINGNDQ